MLLEENQIAFHSQDGLIFDGVKDYSRQIAEMIGLGSDTELPQAGVSLPLVIITNCCFLGNHDVLWGLVLYITWFSTEDYAIQLPISSSKLSLMTAFLLDMICY
jgi:putative pectin methyltransferase